MRAFKRLVRLSQSVNKWVLFEIACLKADYKLEHFITVCQVTPSISMMLPMLVRLQSIPGWTESLAKLTIKTGSLEMLGLNVVCKSCVVVGSVATFRTAPLTIR